MRNSYKDFDTKELPAIYTSTDRPNKNKKVEFDSTTPVVKKNDSVCFFS